MKKTIADLILIPATIAGFSQTVFEITGTVIDSQNAAIASASSNYCRLEYGHVFDLPETHNIHFSPTLKVYHLFLIGFNIRYLFKVSTGYPGYL